VGRRRDRFRVASDAQLGLAWYTREGWERLRELAADRDALDYTFEDWERGALVAIRDLKSVGRQVNKVPVDIEALVAWCREHGRRLDSAARAEFVTHLLQTEADRTATGCSR
jgi:hypothetical protein